MCLEPKFPVGRAIGGDGLLIVFATEGSQVRRRRLHHDGRARAARAARRRRLRDALRLLPRAARLRDARLLPTRLLLLIAAGAEGAAQPREPIHFNATRTSG